MKLNLELTEFKLYLVVHKTKLELTFCTFIASAVICLFHINCRKKG